MKKILTIIIFMVCLSGTAYAAWKLYGYYRVYQDGKEEYEQLTDYVEKQESTKYKSEGRSKEKNRCPVQVDFEALRKINPDLVGWIYIPGTGINYPIVQARDNAKYLHKTFQGKDSYVGAIFLDELCKPDFSSFNSIIYGHNLKNGEMFGHLKKLYDVEYNSKADYRKHPKVWIITPEHACEYEIFAFREIDTRKDKDVYTVELPDHEERRSFYNLQAKKSQVDSGVVLSENRRMITLSTCTLRTEEGRFVVQAIITEQYDSLNKGA